MMTTRIDRIETVTLGEHPNLLFVRIRDSEGRVGLGETFYGGGTVEAWIHETAAPVLVGADPRRIEALARAMTGYVGGHSTGAESRGRSAVDLALWDLAGQRAGRPVFELLGGPFHHCVRVYNTCAGYRYVRTLSRQHSDNWGTGDGRMDGPYEDLEAAERRPAQLARSLLSEGVSAMKIWPFDRYAERTGGHEISAADLDCAVEPIRQIGDAVGDEMDVLVEMHGLWDVHPARKIIAALEPLGVFWVEDPISSENLSGLTTLAAGSQLRLAVGETLAGLGRFRQLCDSGAAGVVIVDPCWSGGITAARKVAALAEAYGISVAAHDCTGPVSFAATVHFSQSMPNTLIQESVRAYYRGWYGELVTGLPEIENGHVTAPDAPGLGVELRAEVFEQPGVAVHCSPQQRPGPTATP
jgi:galactonate dehydratase